MLVQPVCKPSCVVDPEVFFTYRFLSHTIRQIFMCLIHIVSSIADTGVNFSRFSLQHPLLDMKAVTISPFSSLDKNNPRSLPATPASESSDLSHGFLLIFLG